MFADATITGSWTIVVVGLAATLVGVLLGRSLERRKHDNNLQEELANGWRTYAFHIQSLLDTAISELYTSGVEVHRDSLYTELQAYAEVPNSEYFATHWGKQDLYIASDLLDNVVTHITCNASEEMHAALNNIKETSVQL